MGRLQLSSRCLICDETLCLVFDILLQTYDRKREAAGLESGASSTKRTRS